MVCSKGNEPEIDSLLLACVEYIPWNDLMSQQRWKKHMKQWVAI